MVSEGIRVCRKVCRECFLGIVIESSVLSRMVNSHDIFVFIVIVTPLVVVFFYLLSLELSFFMSNITLARKAAVVVLEEQSPGG